MDTNHTISTQKCADLLSQSCPESRYDIHFTNTELIQYTLIIISLGYTSLRLTEVLIKRLYKQIKKCGTSSDNKEYSKIAENYDYNLSTNNDDNLGLGENQENNNKPIREPSSIMKFIRNLCGHKKE